MTQAEKERSYLLPEMCGALVCGLLAAWFVAAFCITRLPPSVMYSVSQGYEDFWIVVALGVCSYIAGYGVLDRAINFLIGDKSEWRHNWMLIPFVGTAFYFANLYWYFRDSFVSWENFDLIITATVFGGAPLLVVMLAFWLCGLVYRTVNDK